MFGSDHLGLVLGTLSARERYNLLQLSVFSYTFDEDDAAVMLGCGVEKAAVLLRDMRDHGLLLFNSECGQHYMHMAVKQHCAALAAPHAGLVTQRRFITHMLRQLAEWSAMFITPAFSVALGLVRHYAADLDEVWRLICADEELAAVCCEEAAATVNQHLEVLLYNASLSTRALSAWEALRRASCAQGLESLAASFNSMTAHEAFWVRDDYKQAKTLLLEIVDVRKRSLGSLHPDTLCSRYNLAWCMFDLKMYEESETILLEVIEAQEQSQLVGPEHHDTLRSMAALSACLSRTDREEEALDISLKVVEAKRRLLGAQHPGTLSSLNNRAVALGYVKRYNDALCLYVEVVEASQRMLGPEHTFSLSSIRNMERCKKRLAKQQASKSSPVQLPVC